MLSKSAIASKIWANFCTILHINLCTSLNYMFKKNFEIRINYTTLTANTCKVEIQLIDSLQKILSFKVLAHLQ